MHKNHNKKAQTAMEFLMTYGWAILIVLIVLAVLFSFGVFNPGTGQNTCRSDDTGVLCRDVKLDDSDNQLQLRLRASGVNTVTYVAASAITLNGVACAVTNDGDGNADGTMTNVKTQDVTVTCASTLATGDAFSGKFVVSATKVGGFAHDVILTIEGTAEA